MPERSLRVVAAYVPDQLDGTLAVVDGDDDRLRRLDSCGLQQIGARGVAVVALYAELA